MMNREEAILLLETRDFHFQGISNDFVRQLLNEVYDDFDSRTCDNCKWHTDIEKSYRYCDVVGVGTSNDFGCNKWEAKQ